LSNLVCAASCFAAFVSTSVGASASSQRANLDPWDVDAADECAVDFFASLDLAGGVASAGDGLASYGVPSPEKYQAIITAGLGCQVWL
jgi:hypothetical protein